MFTPPAFPSVFCSQFPVLQRQTMRDALQEMQVHPFFVPLFYFDLSVSDLSSLY